MKAPPSLHGWLRWAAVGSVGLLGLQLWVHAEPQARPRRVADEEEALKTKQRIEKQLDEILAVQADILKRYDELMAELEIVKVRASR